MDNKKGKFLVGTVKDVARGKGWFFGHFMDEVLLRSDLVDVSWQHFAPPPKPFGEGGPAPRSLLVHRSFSEGGGEGGPTPPNDNSAHYHRGTVEINIVIKGSITCEINHTKVKAKTGDFYILWPEAVMANFRTAPDTDVIVIRAPSIKDGGKVSGTGTGVKVK